MKPHPPEGITATHTAGNPNDSAAANGFEPIAITGIGCRFPGHAHSPEAFWDLLTRGAEGIVDIPTDRWDMRRYYDPDPNKPGKMYVRSGGFLQQKIDEFDALFFGISPREAASMDPQQRIILEVAWEALEDAGLPTRQLAGSDTGVFVGGFMLDNLVTHLGPLNRSLIGPHTAVSSTMTILANRISYLFDLRGPSVSMDTACSSSLVAFHHACRAIWSGDCSVALAGGVNIMFRPEAPISMCKGQFLSPDGRCKSFDERADGYGRGEGAGVVVLRPLTEAVLNGDQVYALVRGTGVNQDGRTEGITVPNPDSQQALIRRVCEQAGIDPAKIQYFEAHGTGTPVGDPIETRALGAVLGQRSENSEPCVVGSVKGNIGHLEAASGVAGVIKTALCLKHQQIPPQANLKTLNPKIPFDELGLRVPRVLEPMPKGDGPSIAGVNSFGYGGTNAHAILQEVPRYTEESRRPDEPAGTRHRGPFLLPISARGEEALTELVKAYHQRLTRDDAPSWADICYSASVRRDHHDWRLALTADSNPSAAEQLEAYLEHGISSQITTGHAVEVTRPVFVFTGMGPQWWAMGRELLEHDPIFREAAQACDEVFRDLAGWSILKEMSADEASSRITQTQIAQPANFVIQAGLAQMWRARGVEPAAIVGHSVGEVTAAYWAGVLDLEDALRVSFHRSRIQKKAAGQGGMLAVGLSAQEAESVLEPFDGRVCIAAANSPSSCTLAGDLDVLEQLAENLEAKEVFNRMLRVEVAYHSPYMEPLEKEVMQSLATLRTQSPTTPLYSTVTAQVVDQPSYDAAYWYQNIRHPVLFGQTIQNMIRDGHRVFLEVGPHPVLSTSIKECMLTSRVRGHVVATLRRKQPERQAFTEALGTLYTLGLDVDWKHVAPAGQFVKLPSYPWQRQAFWNETQQALTDRRLRPTHPLLAQRAPSPTQAWETVVNAQYLPYLNDHRVEGLVVLPGAAYVEVGLALQHLVHDRLPCALVGLRFQQALVVDESEEPTLRVDYDKDTERFSVYSRANHEQDHWVRHATGQLSALRLEAIEPVDLDAVRRCCDEVMEADEHYSRMNCRGLEYGPSFQGVQRLWRRPGEFIASIHCDQQDNPEEPHHIHPAALDACFQSMLATLDEGDDTIAYVPVRIDQVRMYAKPSSRFWCHGSLRSQQGQRVVGDLTLCDDDGVVLIQVRGIHCQALSAEMDEDTLNRWSYAYTWEPAEPTQPVEAGGRWLLLCDRAGVGDAVAKQLHDAGVAADHVIRVVADSVFEKIDDTTFCIRPDHLEDFQQLFGQIDVRDCRHVVHLWALDQQKSQLENDEDPAGTECLTGALHLLQALDAHVGDLEPSPRCTVVTRGAQPIELAGRAVSVKQAPLIGLMRVALNECPTLKCRLIDLDPQPHETGYDPAQDLAAQLLADEGEDEVALRASGRYVHRFVRLNPGELDRQSMVGQLTPTQPEDGYRLEATVASGPDGQTTYGLRRRTRREPEAGEVEVQIYASTFDASVTSATSEAEKTSGAFGGAGVTESIGTVVRVGAQAQAVESGDTVLVCHDQGISAYVTVSEKSVLPTFGSRPEHKATTDHSVGHVRAIGAVSYGLKSVTQLMPGQTVLIQCGQGPTAAAAVLVAKWIGARVIAAVHSEEQGDLLRTLGAQHTIDINSLDWADRVMALTDGQGVDAAVRALDHAEALPSVRCVVSSFGCVLDVATDHAGPRPPRCGNDADESLTHVLIKTDQLPTHRPDVLRQVFEQLRPVINPKDLQSLPAQTLPLSQLIDQATPSNPADGPVVITHDHTQPVSVFPEERQESQFHADGSYIVTGGFGAFGLVLAKWLIRGGARHLTLVGRRGAASNEAKAAVQELQAAGATVTAATVDVSLMGQVQQMISDLDESGQPVRGVFHAAAVLDDAPMNELTADRFKNVMAAKAIGAWNLHRAVADRTLDCFVLFSSISCIIGNARQANYVAANAFLDNLAHHRRSLGLTSTSINWGALGGGGMAAANDEVQQHLRMMGIKAFGPDPAMDALGRVLRWGLAQVTIADVDWQQWAKFEPTGSKSPRFEGLIEQADTGGSAAADALRDELTSLEGDARRQMAASTLAGIVAKTLRMTADNVDQHHALVNIGVDSLMALEIKTAIGSTFGVEVSTLELMKAAGIAQLADRLLGKMSLSGSPVDEQPGRGRESQARDGCAVGGACDDENPNNQDMAAVAAQA